MQQIYPKKQNQRTVVHIDIAENTRPATPTSQPGLNHAVKLSGTPLGMKMTRSTFYVLNQQNSNSTISLSTAHRQTVKSQQSNRRKTSTQSCYDSFSKTAIYASIFTQPINKLNNTSNKPRQPRSYSVVAQLYDEIKVFNRHLLTKQYHLDQKNIHVPSKVRTIHSRNCSSSNTQQGKLQTHKKQPIELRVKPKPWQAKKKGFYIAYSSKKMKNENEKHSFRCCIDPWEIIDRDDPQY